MDPLFRVHRLNELGLTKADRLANAFTAIKETVDEIAPEISREKALVYTHLELASFYAKKAMAMIEANQMHTPQDRPAHGRHPLAPLKYRANPVEVEAQRITFVRGLKGSEAGNAGSDFCCLLEDGTAFQPNYAMTVRMTPQVGDYVVMQSDGYIYLNPQDVFERKYAPIVPGPPRPPDVPGKQFA